MQYLFWIEVSKQQDLGTCSLNRLVKTMSFRDYLHEKAEESRHNETIAYMMFLAGAVFFVGGILENLNLTVNPEWFFFIPYHTTPHGGAALGLTLIISGLALIVFGVSVGINYSRDRRWYMQELHKATMLEEQTLKRQTLSKTPHQ